MTQTPTFVLEREFDAPRELVWKTWTEPELLARWYGPGVETVIHKLDVRPGGLWLNEMKMGDNSSYQRMEYRDVEPPSRLVCLMSNADADWNIAANPMMPDWPQTLLTTVALEDLGGRTKMRLEWTPHEATEAELASFAAAIDNLGKGWGAGMDLLEQILAELQA
ncbi:MAG: SRPBCC domain-containing protein [Parvularculaceae bacterium]